MAKIYVFPSADQPAPARLAATSFELHHPTQTAIPSYSEWRGDSLRLHFGLGWASSMLAMPMDDLLTFLTLEDTGKMMEMTLAAVRRAAEGFGQFKDICDAAEARLQMADAALKESASANA